MRSLISASEPFTNKHTQTLSAAPGLSCLPVLEFGSQGINRAFVFVISTLSPPVDTFYTRWGGGAKEAEPPGKEEQEKEEQGWTGAKVNTRAPSWCGGPRSLSLISRRLWPPSLRDLRVCCTGFCPSAGKGVNTREPPMGPSKATKRGARLCLVGLHWERWGLGGGGQTEGE